jgi:hypothetical protein
MQAGHVFAERLRQELDIPGIDFAGAVEDNRVSARVRSNDET